MSKAIALATVSVLSALAACNREQGASSTSTTGAGILGNEDAVQRLTAQRCQREAECDAIGAGKSYEDYPTCERQISSALRAALTSEQCPYGVREDRMTECAREIRQERCGPLTEPLMRLPACFTARLCVR
jgi:hypothetical protein